MAYDPRKQLIQLKGGRDYLPVAQRVVWFREVHPDWGIQTKAVHLDVEAAVAVYQATVTDPNGMVMAQATKMESARDFGDYIEKAETGAVGRALALCGFGTQFAPELDEAERRAQAPRARDNGNDNGTQTTAAEAPVTGPGRCHQCGKGLAASVVEACAARGMPPTCRACVQATRAVAAHPGGQSAEERRQEMAAAAPAAHASAEAQRAPDEAVSNAVSNAVTNALNNGESTESEYPPYPPKGGALPASEEEELIGFCQRCGVARLSAEFVAHSRATEAPLFCEDCAANYVSGARG